MAQGLGVRTPTGVRATMENRNKGKYGLGKIQDCWIEGVRNIWKLYRFMHMWNLVTKPAPQNYFKSFTQNS